ncbi:MAG: hypothetical protein ACOCUV_00735 [bacterium]
MTESTKKQFEFKECEEVPQRDEKGRLLPGCKALNPGGRPKSHESAQEKLFHALKDVETKRGKRFLFHYIDKAYEDKSMAIALLKKLVPDLKSVEVDSPNLGNWQIVLKHFDRPQTKKVENESENKD